LVAIVENNSCSVDAIQYLTGCTFGKGNLIFRDWGKQVFTLVYRPHGRGVRLSLIANRLKPKNTNESTDREAFTRLLLESPDAALFSVQEVTVALPRTARIFPTLACEECGEGVMEPRLTKIRGKHLCPDCMLKQTPGVIMDQVADFLFETGMLKKTPRTGYQFLGNGSETVADHSFRTAVIGFVLARLTPGADKNKVVSLCLFHDLAEARTGDHNYVNKQYVTVDEKRAGRDAAANAPCGPEIESLLDEFMAGETLEAQLANDADQLDLIFELKEKMDLGNGYAAEWLEYAEKRLKTKIGLDLCGAVQGADWTRWWFERKESLWVRDD
ncbi:MAG: HD domain-containing protein, partial [Thermodesulfobacteriota bacterium]|nr:HD domain-containing protein [Thermodesulfobacteriota bacterium]